MAFTKTDSLELDTHDDDDTTYDNLVTKCSSLVLIPKETNDPQMQTSMGQGQQDAILVLSKHVFFGVF